MNWSLRICVLVVCTLSTRAVFGKNSSVPDWVLQAANEKLPEYPASTKAVVLFEEKTLTVQPNGRAVERYRQVVKILRQQGRRYATVFVPFSDDYKLNSLHVWSIGADGRQYTVKDDQVVEIGRDPLGMLYVDERAKYILPPASDPGGVVAYEAVQMLPAYMSEEGWDFQNSVPTVRSVFDLQLPPTWKYYAAWLRHDAQKPAEISSNHWHWELSDIPGIDLDEVPMAPAEEALAARMVVHYSASTLPEGDARWAAIGNWYDDLASARTEGPVEVSSMAKSLTHDGAGFRERVQKIAEFMQRDIRYVGIEIGIGGLQPHAAADIFRNRYGDCKDKVTLMIAMLSAVGVRSTYVLVDTRRGVVDPFLPSIRGNHAIAAIELPPDYDDPFLHAVVAATTGKRYLIFDPTNPYVPIGILPNYLQGGYGILVAGKNSQVILLPTLKPDADLSSRTAKFDLAADGTMTGEVTESLFGTHAQEMRRVFIELAEVKQRESVESSLKRYFSSFTLESETAENAKELDKKFVLKYSMTIRSYAKRAGANLLLVRPRVMGSNEMPYDQKPRVYPIDMGETGIWRDNFEVHIPAGYVIDDVPAPSNIDVGFASYHSEVKAGSDTLYYKREFVIKELELDPGKYGSYRMLEAAIATDENNSVVLKKK